MEKLMNISWFLKETKQFMNNHSMIIYKKKIDMKQPATNQNIVHWIQKYLTISTSCTEHLSTFYMNQFD